MRGIGITPGRGHLVHQACLAQLAREAGRTTVQHVAGYERQRRHATLVAISLGTSASLTDAAIDLFDRLIGAMFRKAEGRQARAFQADARAINDKVRLYARVGAALIAARDGKQDAFDAIIAVVSWERFCTTVAEAMPGQALADGPLPLVPALATFGVLAIPTRRNANAATTPPSNGPTV